mmetsp:Transcript_60993/g.141016  ORF Transcript_60993/g.141016 Transcript_60993/m.141016 type:complete len:625 (-) Transcript_60993:201-2075(-)
MTEPHSVAASASETRIPSARLLPDELASLHGAIFGQEVVQSHHSEDQSNHPSRFLIHPHSNFRTRWDIIQAIILVYVAIMVPFRVGLREPAVGNMYIFELTVDALFVVDIVFNFFTAVEDEDGSVVFSFAATAKAYCAFWFPIDIIACLPIDIILKLSEDQFGCSLTASCQGGEGGGGAGQMVKLFKILRLFRLVKLLRMVKFARILDRYQDDLFHIMPIIMIMRLLLLLLYVAHTMGCFFNYFSGEEWMTDAERTSVINGVLTSWVDDEELLASPSGAPVGVGARYIACMYWAFTTMTTVGYGDISARTDMERVWAIISMIIGGLMFSGIIATMQETVANMNLSKAAHRHKMNCVAAFMRDRGLAKKFRKPVLRFFRQQQVRAYTDRDLLCELPYHLRRDVLFESFEDFIKASPLFKLVRDAHFPVEVTTRFGVVGIPKGEMVFEKGEYGQTLFCVGSGRVEIVSCREEGNQHKHVLSTGGYFGEGAALGYSLMRTANVVASEGVTLYTLEYEDVAEMFSLFPKFRKVMQKAYPKREEMFTGTWPTIPDEPLTSMAEQHALPHRQESLDVLRQQVVSLQRAEASREAHLEALRQQVQNIQSSLDSLAGGMSTLLSRLPSSAVS